MAHDQDHFVPPGAHIKVIGIGGGGGNAINTMIRTNIEGVDFIAANTDVQALRFSLAGRKIQIGRELTKGLGAGADPDIGRDAMLEDRHAITEALSDAHMVFITAGMGGGTGTGGAAIVAQIAREMGALTVAVVTKPFSFEGKRRMMYAEEGIRRLEDSVDTLITIPNQRLLEVASPDLSMIDAFRLADNVLVNAVKGISDIINIPGQINVDFADVKTVMSSMGLALMGIGIGDGPNRAQEAAHRAISSPLLEDISIEGATGILINITAGESLSIFEVNTACSIIQEAAHEDANIIFGTVIDENVGQQIRITVIATGFSHRDLELGRETSLTRSKRGIYIPKGMSNNTSQTKTADPYKNFETKREERVIHAQAERPIASPVNRETDIHPIARDQRIEETLTKLTFDQSEAEKTKTNESFFEGEKETRIEGATLISSSSKPISSSTSPQELKLTGGVAALSMDDQRAFEGISDEMDRKIDEALKIAEQLSKGPSNLSDEDDLDIPSFLRRGSKDLSLS